MNDFLICSNKECNAKNPANAKFCRMCGHPLHTTEEEYTLGLFPNIELRPIADMNIRFSNFIEKKSFLLLPLLIVFLYFINDVFKLDFISTFGRDTYETVSIGGIILSFILVIFCIKGIKHFFKYSIFIDEADYIEKDFFMLKLRRIAKKKKLGLFDNKKKSVLLKAVYDSIIEYDKSHIQLEIGNKYGIYSIPLRKIIIPVEYDGIAAIKNGIIDVVKDSRLSHFDTHGNELK